MALESLVKVGRLHMVIGVEDLVVVNSRIYDEVDMENEGSAIIKGGVRRGTASSKVEIDYGGGGRFLFVPEKLDICLCQGRFIVVDRKM